MSFRWRGATMCPCLFVFHYHLWFPFYFYLQSCVIFFPLSIISSFYHFIIIPLLPPSTVIFSFYHYLLRQSLAPPTIFSFYNSLPFYNYLLFRSLDCCVLLLQLTKSITIIFTYHSFYNYPIFYKYILSPSTICISSFYNFCLIMLFSHS